MSRYLHSATLTRRPGGFNGSEETLTFALTDETTPAPVSAFAALDELRVKLESYRDDGWTVESASIWNGDR
jgi:hypothetical protein